MIKGLTCGILIGFTGTELLSLVNHHLKDSSLGPVHSLESCSVAHGDKKARLPGYKMTWILRSVKL